MNLSILTGGLAALLLAHTALANEAAVRKAIGPALSEYTGREVKIDAVRRAGVLGLYEVQIGHDVFYTDRQARFFIEGAILDLRTGRNLTEESKQRLSQIKFSDLPLDLAARQVRGNGRRVMATFEDPNCSFCKKLAQELQHVTNVTIYTFVYPIFPQSRAVSEGIWCAPDRAKAWNDFVLKGIEPPAARCDTRGLDRIIALGRQLNVRGTPAIFFADGSRVPGFMRAPDIEKALNERR